MTRISHPNGGQLFAFTAPEANSVQLVGDFTHWLRNPINLKKGAKGIWRTNVPLARGNHRYKFLVNGQWQDGPEYAIRVGAQSGSDDTILKTKGEVK
jgi:1,4-alpha-glucan branching enzyme